MTSNSHPSNGIWGTEESVFVLDRDLRYTAFNSAHAEHMRALYGAEITLGGRLGDYQSVAVDRETAEGNLMRALAGERVVASAFSGEPGSERYIDVVHEPVTDETGQVVGVEVRAFDATERQSIETALREREERYRHLFEGAIDGIYELSLEGRVLAANKAFATMLGYLTGADMTAESADTACPLWADPEDWARFIGMLAEQGILRAYECQLVRRDGTRIWVSINGQVVFTPDGEPACYQGFVEDITERKRAQEVLREKDSQFRTYVENAPVAIIVTRDGICLYANQALADMLGADGTSSFVGGPIYQGFAPQAQEESRERTKRRALGLATPSEFESVLQRTDGSQFPVHVAIGTVELQDGSANICFITDITERRRAEDLFRRSEVMRNVAEHVARVGSWRWDFDPYGFSWSEELFELFDVNPGEFDGDVMSALEARIHVDDADAFKKARTVALETGNAPALEFRVVHKDGSEHIVCGGSTSERDEMGNAVAIVGYFQDITDRREAEYRLETAAAEWRETFDAMGDSVSLFDRDGRIVRCNAATLALTGRGFGEIVGHCCREVFHDRDQACCPLERAFETGQVETDNVERDGAWLRVSFTPKLGGTGHVVGGVYVVTDITQLRHAEQAAAERSHFLEELLEAIPLPVHYKDASLHYVGCNEAFAAALGRSKHEIIGRTVFDLHPADLAKRFDAANRELLAHPQRSIEDVVESVGPTGTPRHLQTHNAAFSDVLGKPAGIVAVDLDVTKIRKAEQELAASAVQLELTLEGAVAALGATTELRDPYTAGHQRRVAELACAIASKLGWNATRLKSLRIAALLHDIGKIVLPAEILAKPGKLSEIEMQLIRQHATAGADTVAPIGFERDVAEMIRQHHERLDGSGYPAGLRDGEILPEARILAVADVVEAMISHRPYRPALAIETAMRELEEGAGTRYDAAACETAISLIREEEFEFTK